MVQEGLLDRDGKHYIVLNSVLKNGSANAATNGHANGQKGNKRRPASKSAISVNLANGVISGGEPAQRFSNHFRHP